MSIIWKNLALGLSLARKTLITMNQKRITSSWITELEENEVFVFGSNKDGQHLGGAAKQAFDSFGAKWGVGEGLTGKCYAIPTMGTLDEMKQAIYRFLKVAEEYTEYTFLVTKVGCGIAGFPIESVAPFFKDASKLKNVYLPEEFFKYF